MNEFNYTAENALHRRTELYQKHMKINLTKQRAVRGQKVRSLIVVKTVKMFSS